MKPQEARFSHVVLGVDSFQGIECREGVEMPFSAGWPLFIIGQARQRGCTFEELADGYGEGEGTHGDWSGIRDSSFRALERMTERALNYLFPIGASFCGCRPGGPKCGLHTSIKVTAPRKRRRS